ncbi:MAG: DUF2807 domain-containing protein [Bacteroidales bacterium]|nr:DUF2807 domain-containing protein [Bacteroidales bacterium]
MRKQHDYVTVVLGVLVIWIFTGCRDSFNECLNGAGSTVTQRIGLYEFENLRVKNNLSLTLRNGENYEMAVTAGENIIPGLGIEIEGNTLVLSNNTTCPMLKDPWTKVEILLTVPHLDTIFLESHGQLLSFGTYSDKSLTIRISDSPATVDLWLECDFLRLENLSGTANIKLAGTAEVVECFHSGYGWVDLTKLVSKSMYINMQSSNDSYVRGGEIYFFAVLGSIGNVYYYNDPGIIELTTSGSGKLIKLK